MEESVLRRPRPGAAYFPSRSWPRLVRRANPAPWRGRRGPTGEKGGHRRASVRLAAHLDPPAMLFDQAANAGQSQTSGFGHAFGRKKRFKEPSLNVRAHAATGVRHLEAHEGPRAGLFMAASLGFINLDGRGA